MKILNFGSLNIDHVYRVPHFVQPGETLSAMQYTKNAGGKGLNQSIALARAGAQVFHAGKIGQDGLFLKDLLEQDGVDTRFLQMSDTPTGHAVIQVDEQGQNCILICGGANAAITEAEMRKTLSQCTPDDLVLLQNEVEGLPLLLKLAAEMGLRVALNPSPIGPFLSECDFSAVHYFIMNEIEGAAITGKKDPIEILDEMLRRFPDAAVVLTLGGDGAFYGDGTQTYVFEEARKVPVVDTTAAGDTFTGYFLTAVLRGDTPADALRQATDAAALAVSRDGASVSIPRCSEI